MNFWTFLDRNAFGLWVLAVAVFVLVATRSSCAATRGGGCSIEIGDHAAAVDGGAP